MKRLLYIVLSAVVATIVIVAQDKAIRDLPALLDVDTLSVSDSIMPADTMAVADSVVTPADSVAIDETRIRIAAARASATRSQRRVNAVNNAATRTQHVNDAEGDTARMIERRRQRSIHYHDPDGRVVMVDTVTGQEWIDSTMLPKPPKMKLPLMYAVEVGVNIWDPVMRIFGQKYGGVDFSAALNLHNRYIPTFEAGFGMTDNTPPGMNFTYKTPMSPYFKIGADYNFIYNSDPDYRFVVGVRYGFSAFSYSLDNVWMNDSYWGENPTIAFPRQNVTAGWGELVLGLRVKIAGPISAGWMFRYHTLLHQTHPATGDAWYIPGFGPSASSITGSFSIVYKFEFKHKPEAPKGETEYDGHRIRLTENE